MEPNYTYIADKNATGTRHYSANGPNRQPSPRHKRVTGRSQDLFRAFCLDRDFVSMYNLRQRNCSAGSEYAFVFAALLAMAWFRPIFRPKHCILSKFLPVALRDLRPAKSARSQQCGEFVVLNCHFWGWGSRLVGNASEISVDLPRVVRVWRYYAETGSPM